MSARDAFGLPLNDCQKIRRQLAAERFLIRFFSAVFTLFHGFQDGLIAAAKVRFPCVPTKDSIPKRNSTAPNLMGVACGVLIPSV